jgi:hypothetical protein
MKKLLIIFILWASIPGCEVYMDKLGIPYELAPFPDLHKYYYSAHVIVIDSTSGLVIDDSVLVKDSDPRCYPAINIQMDK